MIDESYEKYFDVWRYALISQTFLLFIIGLIFKPLPLPTLTIGGILGFATILVMTVSGAGAGSITMFIASTTVAELLTKVFKFSVKTYTYFFMIFMGIVLILGSILALIGKLSH